MRVVTRRGGAVADAPAVAMKAEIVEIDKKLTKVVYQADRAFRAVKDNTKKGLQKQLALDQALLDELRSEESVLRDRRAELEEALVEGEAKIGGVQVVAVMADGITLVFSQLLIFRVDSLLEVECKCHEDATKLDVVLADGHRGASRGNPGL